ncbi:MAG: outer membrane beta-barrel protein [Bacteroidota bacterium]
MNKYLLFLIFTLISTELMAQSSCERNLNEARADYSNGNLYAIPGKLADCLEEGFSKTEKIDALRLLTLTYININQQEKARDTFIKLLNIKTDFQVKQNVDPSELYSLYRKIDTDAKYYIGLTFGVNLNDIQVVSDRNSNPIESNHSAKYSSKLSYPQVGVQFLYPLTKNWIVGVEAQFQNQRFHYKEKNIYINDNNPENTEENFTDISYDLSNNGVNLNINLRYMKDYYKWKPFIELGSVGRYNIGYTILDYLSSYSTTVENENIDELKISSRRVKFNVGASANLGTMIKLGENYGEIKFGVCQYFIHHLNAEARESVFRNTIANGMVLKEDDYTNMVYQISLTFNLPFFNFK